MIVFLDTSVVLRLLLLEPAPLAEWPRLRRSFASRLLLVEAHRAIDRARLAGRLDDDDVVAARTDLARLLHATTMVDVSSSVLSRASESMPTVVATLDAIHAATALEVASALAEPLTVATHDLQLGRACRALGLDVIGC